MYKSSYSIIHLATFLIVMKNCMSIVVVLMINIMIGVNVSQASQLTRKKTTTLMLMFNQLP